MWVPGHTVPPCECGENAVGWIQDWFSDCVTTPWDMLGFTVGLSSILFWLVAQLPQFIRNIQRQSAEALSPWFLFQWLSGDTLNLLGCILTGDQLATETFTACYFIFADCCIITQYVYYHMRNQEAIEPESNVRESDDSKHKPLMGYYWAIRKSKANGTAENAPQAIKAAVPCLLEQAPKQPRAQPPNQHSHYQPVTFLPGRSGAVMIAHAWQGPHKAVGLGGGAQHERMPGEDREGKRKQTKKRGAGEGAGEVPQSKQDPSVWAATGGADLHAEISVVGSGAGTRPPVGPPARRWRVPDLTQGGEGATGYQDPPLRKTMSAGRHKHQQRSLRRVVEEYGLEYGPPLHKRLTIHHNWQQDASCGPPIGEQGQPQEHSRLPQGQLQPMRQDAGSSRQAAGRVSSSSAIRQAMSETRRGEASRGIGKRLQEAEHSSAGLLQQSSVQCAAGETRRGGGPGGPAQREALAAPEGRGSALVPSKQPKEVQSGAGGGQNAGAPTQPIRCTGAGGGISAMSEASHAAACSRGEAASTAGASEGTGAFLYGRRPAGTEGLEPEPSQGHKRAAGEGDGRSSRGSRAVACIAGLLLCSALLQSQGSGLHFEGSGVDKGGHWEAVWGEEGSRGHRLGRRVLEYGDGGGGKSDPQSALFGRWAQRRVGWGSWSLRLQDMVVGPRGAPLKSPRGGVLSVGRRLLVMCGATSQPWWMRLVGLLLGWASAGFYLGSRISQLIRNYQRQSAEGLSMAMFLCAFLANLAYGLAILLRADNISELAGKAPWLLGSMGTLSLDITIFMQAHYLSSRAVSEEIKEVTERTPLLKQIV